MATLPFIENQIDWEDSTDRTHCLSVLPGTYQPCEDPVSVHDKLASELLYALSCATDTANCQTIQFLAHYSKRKW